MIQHFCGYIGLINFISCFFFSVFVFFKNPRSRIHQIFSAWSFAVSMWSFGYFIWMILAKESASALMWSRFLNGWAVVIVPVFLHFTLIYLNLNEQRFYRGINLASYGFFATLLAFMGTPWMIAAVEPRFWFAHWPVPGLGYHIFIIGFIFTVIFSHILFFRAAFQSKGIIRKQLFTVAVGTLIAYIGGSTNFFLFYNIPIPPVSNFLVLAYVALMFYAILHYKLWDIDVILKKTLVFTSLFGAVMTIVVAMTTATQVLIGQFFKIHPWVSMGFAVALAMSLYEPTKKSLMHITDKFLFQKTFRLSSIMAQASQAIAFVQSLKWLSRRIVAFLITKCRIQHAAVYMRNETNGNFFRGAIRGYPLDQYPPEELPSDHFLIRYLYETRRPIERQRLEELLEKHQNSRITQTGLHLVIEFMKACKAQVMVPSFLRRRIEEIGMGREMNPSSGGKDEEIVLRNILILGGKKSDEPYSEDDLDMFYSLAQESAIAIENARLYDEAVEKTKLLALMNRELADTNGKLQVTQASLIVAEKNATMVGMAQAIGHEVNNPLTTVLMRVDTIYKDKVKRCKDLVEKMLAQAPSEDAQKLMKTLNSIEDDISRASRSAHRINAVVHTLTDILRDTKGEMGALSLRVMFHEAIEATRFSTYEENLAGCDIKLDVASNIMVRGNLEQLMQVFVNLIKNAYEAMDKTKERRILISADTDPENPKMARIQVADNGPGISPEVLPRIWGQGFTTKIRRDQSLGAAGQGQGLFVCKHMIESVHRGSIVCESKVGKGTTFTIKLPVADMEVPHA